MKQLFLLCVFCLGLYATSLHVNDNKEQIITNQVDILQKDVSFEKAIHETNYKNIPNTRKFLRQNLSNQNYWLKFSLKNTKNTSLKKTLTFFWKNTDIDLYTKSFNTIEGPFPLAGNNQTGVFYHELIFAPKQISEIYLHVKKTKIIQDFHEISLLNTKDFLDTIIQEKGFYDNGFLMGILISMLFFNIILFLSTSRKHHLYFALSISIMILIFSHIRWYVFEAFPDYSNYVYHLFRVINPRILIICLILFTKDFFQLKKRFPKINTILNIYLFFACTMLFFPYSLVDVSFLEIGLPLLLITGIFCLKKYEYSALFYIFGILSIIPIMIIHNMVDKNIYYNFHQIFQMCAVLCSFWISCATYINLKNIVEERIAYEKQSCVQSRFTTMGEVIGNIAHQWRQPLNHLASVVLNIEMHNENKALTKTILEKMLNDMKQQLNHMSMTIDDFMNFFAQKEVQEQCSYKEIIYKIKDILQASLNNYNITLHVKVQTELTMLINTSKLKQVLLIILANSMDALKESTNTNKEITVIIEKDSIAIIDNAGGIDKKIINKIFDPYFTTKQEKHGTGLGLYTAKNIIEKNMNGKLKVENIKDGVKFTILLAKRI